MPKPRKGLSAKQEKFCNEYLVDLCGTKAAIRAGYSEKTAQQMASENLLKPLIYDRIKELRRELINSGCITPQMIVSNLAKIAESNIKTFINGGNEILEVKFIPDDLAYAVKKIVNKKTVFIRKTDEGISETITYTSELELKDSLEAMEKLMKHLGLFEVDNKQKSDTIVFKYDEGEE